MAPISQLHGLGVEEFSQTGPTDNITAIVNRTKTNVVGTDLITANYVLTNWEEWTFIIDRVTDLSFCVAGYL